MSSIIHFLALVVAFAVVPSSPASPFETLPNGSLRHNVSGMLFPERIGFFRRAETRQYNELGSDVSVGYDAGALVVATVYAYPAPANGGPEVLAREYAAKRTEVLRAHNLAKLISEGPVTILQSGHKLQGERSAYYFHDTFLRTPQELKSQLLVFRDGPIFVEYRFTYPRDHAERADQEIEAFIHDWSWREAEKGGTKAAGN